MLFGRFFVTLQPEMKNHYQGMKKLLLISLLALLVASCSTSKEYLVRMNTTEGTIDLKLYKETKEHRDNFIKLVKEHKYDSLLFHRVIQDFMIQSGDPDSKKAPRGKMLGEGDLGYKIPAEFMPELYFHKRGALAAAREAMTLTPRRPLRLRSSTSCGERYSQRSS